MLQPSHNSQGGPLAPWSRGGGEGQEAGAGLTCISTCGRPPTRTSRSCWPSAQSCRSGWRTCSGKWRRAPQPRPEAGLLAMRLSSDTRAHVSLTPLPCGPGGAPVTFLMKPCARLVWVALPTSERICARDGPHSHQCCCGISTSFPPASTCPGPCGGPWASRMQGSGSRWDILVKTNPPPPFKGCVASHRASLALSSKPWGLTVNSWLGKTDHHHFPMPAVLLHQLPVCTYKVFLKRETYLYFPMSFFFFF